MRAVRLSVAQDTWVKYFGHLVLPDGGSRTIALRISRMNHGDRVLRLVGVDATTANAYTLPDAVV